MSQQRSVGRFCSIVVTNTTGAIDSVSALSTQVLGNGAEVYCLANNKIYRFQQSASSVTVLPNYIAPVVGGGCWEMVNPGSFGSLSDYGNANFQALGTFTPVSNIWRALPTGSNTYSSTGGATGAMLTSSSNTGVLTYAGPTGRSYFISAQFTIRGTSPSDYIESLFTENGALIGTSTASVFASSAGWTNTAESVTTAVATFTIIQALNSGSTYQMIWRPVTGGGGTCLVQNYKLSALLLA
jgi:hypothetical protein